MNNPPAIAWTSLAPRAPAESSDHADRLRQAVLANSPLEAFLQHAAERGHPVLLLVNDTHRATLTRPVLLALGELVASLRHKPRLRAVVATGTHKFPAAERSAFEQATFADCGLHIAGVSWHDADDPDLVPSGAGRIHRWVAENDFLLPIGSVEPHYFAGLTGAHKTVTIGVLSRRDIERNHAGALDPASDVFRLAGNPVYDGVAALVHALRATGKHIVAINEVVAAGRLIDVAIGDPLETLHALAPLVRRTFLREIPAPVDVLHLRVPLPLGRAFYQADKALKNNHHAVRDGGGIVLEAPCPEGVGPDAFLHLLRRAATYAEARRLVAAEGYVLGDHKAVKLRHLTDPAARGVRVALVSRGVSEEVAAAAGLRGFREVAAALAWLHGALTGPCARGLIIDDAANTVVLPAL